MDKERLLEIVCFVHAFVGTVFGIIFIFFTDGFIILTGWPTTDLTTARLLGAAFIGFSFASIVAWKRVEWSKIQIIIEMEIVWLTIGIIIMFFGALFPLLPGISATSLPPIIWLYIAIFIAFDAAFSYIYYLFRKK